MEVFRAKNIITLTKLCSTWWTRVAAIVATFSLRSILCLAIKAAGPSGKNSVLSLARNWWMTWEYIAPR